jgi:hypothetical protein
MSPLIWIHADCLHRSSPCYQRYPQAPSIFVFDDAELIRSEWSLKRIGFIYECLLDLPVTIRRGDPLVEVVRFAAELKADRLAVVETIDPHLKKQITAVSQQMPVEILAPPPFVQLKGNPDLKRFSRYWQKAESQLL